MLNNGKYIYSKSFYLLQNLDTIPRPSNFGQQNSVKFLPISSGSLDNNEGKPLLFLKM